MDQAGEVSADGQENVDEELDAQADFEEGPEGRYEDGNDNAKKIHMWAPV